MRACELGADDTYVHARAVGLVLIALNVYYSQV